MTDITVSERTGYTPLTTQGTRLLIEQTDGHRIEINPDTPDGLRAIAPYWTRATWSNRMFQKTRWFGLVFKQLPEDMAMLQEVFWDVQPDVVIETGISKGGSTLFWASLLAATGGREVVSVDIEIPRAVRRGIRKHPLGQLTTLIEGSSVDPDVVAAVRSRVREGDRVLLMLDSDHSRDHVLAELDAYADLVPQGSYVLVADGVMQVLLDARKGDPGWDGDNPLAAADEWLARHPEFVRDLDRESLHATYFPGGWLRRVGDAAAAPDRRPTLSRLQRELEQVRRERDRAQQKLEAMRRSATWRAGRMLVAPGAGLKRLARRRSR